MTENRYIVPNIQQYMNPGTDSTFQTSIAFPANEQMHLSPVPNAFAPVSCNNAHVYSQSQHNNPMPMYNHYMTNYPEVQTNFAASVNSVSHPHYNSVVASNPFETTTSKSNSCITQTYQVPPIAPQVTSQFVAQGVTQTTNQPTTPQFRHSIVPPHQHSNFPVMLNPAPTFRPTQNSPTISNPCSQNNNTYLQRNQTVLAPIVKSMTPIQAPQNIRSDFVQPCIMPSNNFPTSQSTGVHQYRVPSCIQHSNNQTPVHSYDTSSQGILSFTPHAANTNSGITAHSFTHNPPPGIPLHPNLHCVQNVQSNNLSAKQPFQCNLPNVSCAAPLRTSRLEHNAVCSSDPTSFTSSPYYCSQTNRTVSVSDPTVTQICNNATLPVSQTFLDQPSHFPTQQLPNFLQPCSNSNPYFMPVYELSGTDNVITDSKDKRLSDFLEKIKGKSVSTEKKQKCSTTVAEFRSMMKSGFDILKELSNSKETLKNSLEADETLWNHKVRHIVRLQGRLSNICRKLLDPNEVQSVQARLNKIKKRREHKKIQKEHYACLKRKKEQSRAEVDRDIDRWLDLIKEKNLQLKKETEMKKEADNILAEVRKKIYEAKRTVEKLKVFEKLRQSRKENAIKKGMFILPTQDANFEQKVSTLKEAMLKQLSDYEAEERALKVMLETEQEGQREEEALWRLKKLKERQDKKQTEILHCLFGDSVPPSPTDPLFFFWQHYNAGNSSIESLLKIRQVWDMLLVPPSSSEGAAIPQQWVVPEPPSIKSWDVLEGKE